MSEMCVCGHEKSDHIPAWPPRGRADCMGCDTGWGYSTCRKYRSQTVEASA